MTTIKRTIFRASTRGTADFGWLKANYFFSFANHYDPNRMGFGKLLVFNDDDTTTTTTFYNYDDNDDVCYDDEYYYSNNYE